MGVKDGHFTHFCEICGFLKTSSAHINAPMHQQFDLILLRRLVIWIVGEKNSVAGLYIIWKQKNAMKTKNKLMILTEFCLETYFQESTKMIAYFTLKIR